MPIIRPYTDLQTNYAELSAILHQTGEPIFITKDGQVDTVLLSIEAWEQFCTRWQLYDELEALDAIRRDLHSGEL